MAGTSFPGLQAQKRHPLSLYWRLIFSAAGDILKTTKTSRRQGKLPGKDFKNMESRNDIIKRINNTINIYAADDQTLRELERVVTGWLAMKRKIKSRYNNNKEVK
jgi:hypothetical protein